MRMFHRLLIAAFATALAACAGAPKKPTPDEKQALAPAGSLRVAFLATTPIHATRDAQSGEFKGPAVDLGREMARRIGARFDRETTRRGQRVPGVAAVRGKSVLRLPDQLERLSGVTAAGFTFGLNRIQPRIELGEEAHVVRVRVAADVAEGVLGRAGRWQRPGKLRES